MKALDIAVKNLKVIIRDKKVILIMILIPIFYYSLMGVVFGNMGGVNLSQYTIGFINRDVNSEETPIEYYRSLDWIIGTMENSSNTEDKGEGSLFKIRNLTVTGENGILDYNSSLSDANYQLKQEDIIAYVVFEKGFQEAINEASINRIGIYVNDSTTNSEFDTRFKRTFLFTLLQNMNYQTMNLTLNQYNNALSNFSLYNLDYILRIEEGYEQEIKSGDPSLTLLYSNYTSSLKSDIFYEIFNTTINDVITGAGGSSVTINTQTIAQIIKPIKPQYNFYFLGSTNPTTITIINSTFNTLLDNIINYDPNAIDFEVSSKQTEDVAINDLTYSSPGYLLYGVLNIMSFAMVLITSEIKEGQLKRLLSSRMKTTDLLMGNIIANTLIVYFQMIIGFLVLMMWGMHPYYLDIFTLIVGMTLNTFVLSIFINALALSLVPVFKTPDSSAGGVWIFLIPLMAFSGVFFPIEFMPVSIASAVRWIPTRMAVLAYQALMVNGLGLLSQKFLFNLIGQAIFGIIFYLFGMIMFQKFIRGVSFVQKSDKKS